MSKPNILWFCTDQQRYDTIHALGNASIRTPALDALCARGVAFTRTYCQSPVCTPSRASFLTGLHPSSIHVNRNGNGYFPDGVPLVTTRLAQAGYYGGLIGKLHLASGYDGVEARRDDGYTEFYYSHSPVAGFGKGSDYLDWVVEQGSHPDEIFETGKDGQYTRYRHDMPEHLHQSVWCAERARSFIASRQSEPGPWMLSINTFDPHPPFDAPAAYEARYDEKELPGPLFGPDDLQQQERLRKAYHGCKHPKAPDGETRRMMASYYGMIELIDAQFGRIVDTLEKTGQLDNTIIIFMSDHGEMLGDHGLSQKGCRFYEGAVRVPLIVSWPGGGVRKGEVNDQLMALLDIAPTLCELTGVESGLMHGRSFASLLTQPREEQSVHRTSVRSEYYDAVTERDERGEIAETKTPSLATMFCDGRYKLTVYHHIDEGELYDLETDPGEFDNLWNKPAYLELQTTLLKRSFDESMVIMDQGPPKVHPY
ncbi:sulfatase [Paenibacillus sp. 1P07SE]|uniref:sulfatase family protein n=1 Tax=Paenibacillus sp. 1P07SE TaxID=3132209 RepID=UPI0039A49D9F